MVINLEDLESVPESWINELLTGNGKEISNNIVMDKYNGVKLLYEGGALDNMDGLYCIKNGFEEIYMMKKTELIEYIKQVDIYIKGGSNENIDMYENIDIYDEPSIEEVAGEATRVELVKYILDNITYNDGNLVAVKLSGNDKITKYYIRSFIDEMQNQITYTESLSHRRKIPYKLMERVKELIFKTVG